MSQAAQQPPNPALVIYRPLVEKVVAALGALVTHQLAYLVASLIGLTVTSPSDHGHLSLQLAVVAPMAVGAAAGFILWQLKVLGFRSVISARQLTGLIVAFFLTQETIEGLTAGLTVAEVLASPAIIAGVIIAPLVAWVISRLLAGVTELAARLLAGPEVRLPNAGPKLIPVPVYYRAISVRAVSRPRAPPLRLRI